MMKKILTGITAAAILGSSFIGVCAADSFSDVNYSTAQGAAIGDMSERGYVRGFGDGTFRPGATLTRAEFVTIINRMYNFTVKSENVFSDVHDGDWFSGDVLAAKQAGYIKGMGDGTFCPNDTVSREQVCVMLNSILKVEKLPAEISAVAVTDYVSEWAKNDVEALLSIKLFSLESGGKFRATEPITRGEVCEALKKCMIDTEPADVSREETEKRLERVIAGMEEKVIPGCSAEKPKKVAQMITDSMKAYLADPNYDYTAATKAAYEVYRTQTRAEADELQRLVLANINTEDLLALNEFFFESGVDEVIGRE